MSSQSVGWFACVFSVQQVLRLDYNSNVGYLDDRPLDLLLVLFAGPLLLLPSELLLEPPGRSLFWGRRRPGEPSLEFLLPERPRPRAVFFVSTDRLRPLLPSGVWDRLTLDLFRRSLLGLLDLERDRRRDFEPITNFPSMRGLECALSHK